MLNDVMRLFRIKAEVYHNAKVCGDWLIQESHLGQTCFHMPTQGSCLLRIPGQDEQRLNTGDLVIFPQEIPHSMCPSQPCEGPQQHLPYTANETGTGMICGRMLFSHDGFKHVLAALPSVMIIRYDESNPWLAPMLRLIISESYRDDGTQSLVLDRLSELIFLFALRHHVEQDYSEQGSAEQNSEKVGMLALYSNASLSHALTAIHRSPSQHWTVATLAEHCFMSRTRFSTRFKQCSGWTPMQYLTWWRMQIAWSLLAEGKSIALVADKVGYLSESAFSNAFKKVFGLRAGKVKERY
ncbi:MAG: AraC-like DNA-binding protein [Candidatus Endobugula sp.]|jgi:AraC-like DNA-binding protein